LLHVDAADYCSSFNDRVSLVVLVGFAPCATVQY